MPEPRCVVTAPVPPAAGFGFTSLAMIVTADALVRRAWAGGRAAELLVPTLSGDLRSQYALERELAREGLDLATFDAGELDGRRATFLEERRVRAAELLAALSVAVDLGASSTASADVALAAQTAFVRLFEEGVVEEAERVVATCPRCRTAVDLVDAEQGTVDGERVTVRLIASTGAELALELTDLELLPGVVAVAVPAVSELVGASVGVPIAGRRVPIVASADHLAPAAVVAAHDGEAHALAMANGLVPVVVLDADGTVRSPGPLDGLGRYAARAAARSLLEAEGVVVDAAAAHEDVWRCRCCGTVLVPQLGRHWFLRGGDLEVAAADAVRNGLVGLSPPDAREAFLAGAGLRAAWCISTTVAGGVAIPASTCRDCGKSSVDLDQGSSCGKCMGELAPEPLFLDARFVAAVWAVTLGGWPGPRAGAIVSAPEEALAVVTGADLAAWVLPAIALGLRLTATSPFAGVIVHPWPDVVIPDDVTFLDGDVDRRVLRLALVAGVDDVDAARAAVEALDRPAADTVDVAEVADAAAAGIAALDEGSPARAAGLLASALGAGVPSDAADRLRALALPILGD